MDKAKRRNSPEPTPVELPAENVPLITSETVRLPQIVYTDQYLALYTQSEGLTDPGADAGVIGWTSMGLHPSWELALGSLMTLSGVRGIRIVKMNLPTYITGVPLDG